MSISLPLLKWYKLNRRDLPWRRTDDPYKIWISEIILQQTRVDQGLDYYARFIIRFPDIHTLAKAKEEEVLKFWQGLGYYSRARNLHTAAKEIINGYKGVFPNEYNKVLELRGIGPYTAAAICSIAFGQAYPVIDGNVIRVLSRLLAIEEPATNARVKKIMEDFLEKEIDQKDPGSFNQAMMELGALICKPTSPLCNDCPLKKVCTAFLSDRVSEFPVKTIKNKVKPRFFHYLVVLEKGGGNIYIHRRGEEDIWAKLYDFPMIEGQKGLSLKELKKLPEWAGLFKDSKLLVKEESRTKVHKLSHRDLHLCFYTVIIEKPLKPHKNILRIPFSKLDQYPLPVPIAAYISRFQQSLP